MEVECISSAMQDNMIKCLVFWKSEKRTTVSIFILLAHTTQQRQRTTIREDGITGLEHVAADKNSLPYYLWNGSLIAILKTSRPAPNAKHKTNTRFPLSSISGSLKILAVLADEAVFPVESGTRCFMPEPSATTAIHAHTVTKTVQKCSWMTTIPVEPRRWLTRV